MKRQRPYFELFISLIADNAVDLAEEEMPEEDEEGIEDGEIAEDDDGEIPAIEVNGDAPAPANGGVRPA